MWRIYGELLEVAFEKGKNFTYKEKREDSIYM